eukprot:gene9696-biopygen6215
MAAGWQVKVYIGLCWGATLVSTLYRWDKGCTTAWYIGLGWVWFGWVQFGSVWFVVVGYVLVWAAPAAPHFPNFPRAAPAAPHFPNLPITVTRDEGQSLFWTWKGGGGRTATAGTSPTPVLRRGGNFAGAGTSAGPVLRRRTEMFLPPVGGVDRNVATYVSVVRGPDRATYP